MRAVLISALLLVLVALGIYALWWPAAAPAKALPARAAAPAGTGEMVYRQGSYSVRLNEQPCAFQELRDALQADDAMGDAKAAVVMEGARRISGCWVRGIDEVQLQDMAGHGGSLPLEWFKREPVT